MDQARFDSLARRAGRIGTRRGILGAGLGDVFGALTIGDLDARKRNGKQKGNGGKPMPNEFGCLNVGKACAGRVAIGIVLFALAVLLATAAPVAVTAKPDGTRFKTVTRTFSNATPIEIPEEDAANPYPSTIEATGFKQGKVRDVNVRLRDFSHVITQDVDILLVAPGGRSAIILSDVAFGESVNNVTVTLDDQAAQPLPADDELVTGAFRPANLGDSNDPFPAPAPTPDGAVALAAFNGINPNGEWQLFVVDDQEGFTGSVAGGWELKLKVKVKKSGKGKGRGNR
jgi:subtilisin-like proprotein convertase family protein